VSMCALPGLGQEKSRTAGRTDERSNGLVPLYLGVSVCADCHKRDKLPENPDLPPLCQCNENFIWEARDKHRDAYDVLLPGSTKGELAQHMGKLLKIKNVAEAKECLACHGVDIKDDKYKDKSFKRSDGVSCVVCHGAYENWIDDHGSAVP